MNLGIIFLSETVGTMMLILLGCGVVASVVLNKSKASNAGFTHINWAWGLAVMFGVMTSYKSGGHLNPAVTVGLVAGGTTEFVPGIPVNIASILTYIAAQFVGAMIGATLVWLAFLEQFKATDDKALKLAVFGTAPEVRSTIPNLITEIIGTFVLVFVVIASGKFTGNIGGTPANLGWLGAFGVGLLVVSIGLSLGGPTGYAINPARDLGPRMTHALLPIPGKGGSDWEYSWIPVVGPMIGGVIAGLLSGVLLPAV